MLCWKLPCRSKGFIPSHPSKAAGNVFQLDHILSCMADLGWGTLPAPADPEPSPAPLPRLHPHFCSETRRWLCSGEHSKHEVLFSIPCFFPSFPLLPPAAPDWRLWAGFSKPCGAGMALKFWVGRLGREMFPPGKQRHKRSPKQIQGGCKCHCFHLW